MNINIMSGNEKILGEKIRYIKYHDQNYIIFSLKEQDEEGYEKLYINKITNDNEDVIEESEWEELKNVIPSIVKQIKLNYIMDFEDLDLKEIDKVDLMYSKPFKLKINIVEIIKKTENIAKIEEELEELVGNGTLENNIIDVDDLDEFLNNYEEKLNEFELPIRPDTTETESEEDIKIELEKQKNINDELNNKIEELETELTLYKEKLERIKIMLEA